MAPSGYSLRERLESDNLILICRMSRRRIPADLLRERSFEGLLASSTTQFPRNRFYSLLYTAKFSRRFSSTKKKHNMADINFKRSEIDAIIFDCDGTLVDSEPITVQVLVDHVGEFGLKLDYEEALGLFVGRDMTMIVEVLEKRIGKSLPDDFVEEYRRRQEIELRRSVQLIPGAIELVTEIEKSGSLAYCVASNAPRRKINLNLEVTGLNQFFKEPSIFSAYDIQKWKPDPALFLHAAERIDVTPGRCVVIEDSVAGIEAGIAARMKTIGYSPSPAKQPTDQVHFVHHLADLIPIFQ